MGVWWVMVHERERESIRWLWWRQSPRLHRQKSSPSRDRQHFISSKYNWERLNHCAEKSYKNIKYTLCVWKYLLWMCSLHLIVCLKWLRPRILPGLLIHICCILCIFVVYFSLQYRNSSHGETNILTLFHVRIRNRSGIAPRVRAIYDLKSK